MSGFRRVITGHDTTGRSVVASDELVAEGALGNFNFFRLAAKDAPVDLASATSDFPFFPGAGQTVFRIFQLPGADPNLPAGALEEFSKVFFAGIGSPDAKVDTSRHPLMHRTPTTDFIVLLSGAVSLLLDEGEPIALKPFDAVVQRATNHAWVVTGSEPAVLMACMNGTGSA
ncbi:MAG: cupin domain-containing protein [Devosia nanyangense]|uniref:Cupin domain-containing protein n=1 Tax=Devosia nanyangense TaxID=1228055 RepID=A0A933NYP4_9HYPH|nr:cupin domain-containing protein [Devosia nanyangense]